MPEGLIGAGAGVSPTEWSSAELGAGFGYDGDHDAPVRPQVAFMLGLRARVSEPATLGLSSGLSFGPYATTTPHDLFDSEDPGYTVRWRWALWSNTEMTLRHAIDAQTAVRFHAGLAASLAAAHPTGASTDAEEWASALLPDFLPYVGLGFERHF